MKRKSRAATFRSRRRKKWVINGAVLLIVLILAAGGYKGYKKIQALQARNNAKQAIQTKRTEEKKDLAIHAEASTMKEKEIEEYLYSINFNGSAYIEDKGKFVISRGYGFANLEKYKANNAETAHLIGSAQKTVIATAVLQLVEQGKLSLTAPISQYIPGFPNGTKILVRDFLRHTSGIKGHRVRPFYISPTQLIESIKAQGIRSQPGKWHYLDDNYSVLAYLIQKESGQSLASYLKQHIFDVANMPSAGLGKSFYSVPNHGSSYMQSKDGILEARSVIEDFSQVFGAGDMYMNAIDLARFDQALQSGKLISKSSVKQMLTKGPHSKYGYGVYEYPSFYVARGVYYGYQATNFFSKDGKKTIVLLTNGRAELSLIKASENIFQIMNKK
ncbi:serine hydrolase [Listeria sp. PSOL-1]|uniref:serine hydrolase domain-containing protein n=1 Tax=Listeria sp. PSOL-1 TaxID=1844999 RepID=UPI0013D4A79D|nr:serine hydrolase domain-containing protein [Listeria sp. PSOL-1]